jgi:hypothetical protein
LTPSGSVTTGSFWPSSATGFPATPGDIAGALTIARWRVVALVVAILWIGAMLCGFAYDFLATLSLL